MNICEIISKEFYKALLSCNIPFDFNPEIKKSKNQKFGDYQSNGIIKIAKKLNINPKILAEKVVSYLNLDEIADKIKIEGPGFINIFLNPKWISLQLNESIFSSRLNINTTCSKKNIIIDYSSPNMAKDMHVGHMRSTILGDALARILSFLGHNVTKINHIGDWGNQFGMLIAYLEKMNLNNQEENFLSDLNTFYYNAQKKFEEDENFANISRKYVVKLQQDDSFCKEIWKKLVKITLLKNKKIYKRLNITLSDSDIIGESFYKDMVPKIVEDLRRKGLAVKQKGAIVIVLDEFKNKEGKPTSVVIKKKDGAYLYITTEIASIKYRYEKLNAQKLIYYVDSRQHQHLKQAWIIARKAGYIP